MSFVTVGKTGQAVKPACSGSYTICFTLLASVKSTSAKDNFAAKTSLAVSSTKFCQSIFDESYIWRGLGSCCGHTVMILSLWSLDVQIKLIKAAVKPGPSQHIAGKSILTGTGSLYL